jgi:signal transduction histidine kinase
LSPPLDYLAFCAVALAATFAVVRFSKLERRFAVVAGAVLVGLAVGWFYVGIAGERESGEIRRLADLMASGEAHRAELYQRMNAAGTVREAVERSRLGAIFVLAAVLAVALVSLAAMARLRRAAAELTERNLELARARDAALAASQAKSRFLANVSHELRTPLHVFLGMNELLLDSTLDDRQRKHGETARRAAEGLLGMVDDLLDYAQLEAGKLSSDRFVFELAELVAAAGDQHRAIAEAKGLPLHTEIDDSARIRLLSDPRRLRQILRHLLGNAVKFTDRGEIRLRATVRPTPSRDGSEAVLEVIDTGIGVDPERRAEVFASFSQIDPSSTRRYGGTGIGLALSRALAERLGGSLELESETGRGSTFRLIFPVREPPPPPPGP